MTRIRSFRNSDLPALLDVWLAHWSVIGPPPEVNLPRLEQAIVSRTFFSPHELLVATDNEKIQGWFHYTVADDASTGPATNPTANIASVSMMPDADGDVGRSLMTEALRRMRASGFRTVVAGLVRDDAAGYAGLQPIVSGIGILDQDLRTSELLMHFGFEPTRRVTRMVASTDCFRPPVSREALQLRRTSTTQSTPRIPETRRRASGLSHIDIEQFELRERTGETLAKVEFWFSDAEAEVLSPAMSILNLRDVHPRGELSSSESYLIASVMQSLSARSVYTVETAVDSEKKTLIQQLETICFAATDSGSIWQLKL